VAALAVAALAVAALAVAALAVAALAVAFTQPRRGCLRRAVIAIAMMMAMGASRHRSSLKWYGCYGRRIGRLGEMPGGAVPPSPLGLTPHLALARPPVALDAATVPAAAGVLAIMLVVMATLGGLGVAAPVAAPVSALAVAVAKPTRHRRCTSLVRPVAPGTMAPLGLVFGRRRPVKAWCRRPRRRQRYLLT
jgi:hypothetical protein